MGVVKWCGHGSLGTTPDGKLNRAHRSVVWLYKMLWDFVVYDHFEYEEIINDLSYEVKNDKAFSVSGSVSASLIQCPEIRHPYHSRGRRAIPFPRAPSRRNDCQLPRPILLACEPSIYSVAVGGLV